MKILVFIIVFCSNSLFLQAQATEQNAFARLYYLSGWTSSNYQNLNNILVDKGFSPVNSRFQPFLGIGWDFEYRNFGLFFDIKMQYPVRSGDTRNWHSNLALGTFYNIVQKKNFEFTLWGNVGYTDQYMTTRRKTYPSSFQDLLDFGNALTLRIGGVSYEGGIQFGFKRAQAREYVKIRIGYRFSSPYAWREDFSATYADTPYDRMSYFTVCAVGYPLNNRAVFKSKKQKQKMQKFDEQKNNIF